MENEQNNILESPVIVSVI